MNRKDFLKFGSGALMMSAMPFGARAAAKKVPEFAKGAEELPPILDDFEYGSNPALKGHYASFFIDAAIWSLRDIARMRPTSLFAHFNRQTGGGRDVGFVERREGDLSAGA